MLDEGELRGGLAFGSEKIVFCLFFGSGRSISRIVFVTERSISLKVVLTKCWVGNFTTAAALSDDCGRKRPIG